MIHDAGGPGLGGQPRLRRPQPAPGARRRPRPPRRAAGRPRPDARRGLAPDRRRRARRPRGARGPRPDGVAEDVRVARLPHLRAHRARAGRSSSCGWPPRRSRARSNAALRTSATSRWWKEERQGVFVDFNQNAKDRTVASAYSVRATPDARVSTPLLWDEVADCRPEEFTVATVPQRFARVGDPWEGMDDAAGALESLLDLADRLGPAEKAPKGARRSTDGRRQSTKPLIEIARTKTKDEAMAALEHWRDTLPGGGREAGTGRHPGRRDARARVRSGTASGSTCSTCREGQRPPQEPLLADYNPWSGYTGSQQQRRG